MIKLFLWVNHKLKMGFLFCFLHFFGQGIAISLRKLNFISFLKSRSTLTNLSLLLIEENYELFVFFVNSYLILNLKELQNLVLKYSCHENSLNFENKEEITIKTFRIIRFFLVISEKIFKLQTK